MPAPGSARIRKGALIVDPTGADASYIPFQYNPETVKRTVTPKDSGGGGGGGAGGGAATPTRVTSPPTETIDLTIEFDATDQLEREAEPALSSGVYPSLAALEILLYPPSFVVNQHAALAKQGAVEIVRPAAPLLLLYLGPYRIMPVKIKSVNVTEEAFDANLNPIRATVALSLEVQTYAESGADPDGSARYMSYQQNKESMAQLGSIAGLFIPNPPPLTGS